MNNRIFGSADGPTAVFLTVSFGEGDFPWFAVFGLVSMLFLFLPNIIARIRRKEMNLCESRLMNSAEQLGLLFSLFIILCWVGYGRWGFRSLEAFLCYISGNMLLIALNWVLWLVYYFMAGPRIAVKADGPTAVFVAGKKQVRGIMTLKTIMAAVPAVLFLLDGLTLHHWLLVGSALVYGVGHIYVTRENINMRTGKNTQN